MKAAVRLAREIQMFRLRPANPGGHLLQLGGTASQRLWSLGTMRRIAPLISATTSRWTLGLTQNGKTDVAEELLSVDGGSRDGMLLEIEQDALQLGRCVGLSLAGRAIRRVVSALSPCSVDLPRTAGSPVLHSRGIAPAQGRQGDWREQSRGRLSF